MAEKKRDAALKKREERT